MMPTARTAANMGAGAVEPRLQGGRLAVLPSGRAPAARTECDAPVLRVEGLSVEFRRNGERVKVVDDISFTIGQSETVALVGESGSGKSVTSLAIMGLLDRRSAMVTGAIHLADGDHERDLTAMDEDAMCVLRGDRLSMIFQEPMTSLNPVHSIGEQIAEPLLIHRRMSGRERRAAAIEILARVGIPEPARRVDQYPHELSGGMRQRVMIGMALICEPTLLIADEPTTALDVTIQAQVLSDLGRLQRDLGMSMLFVTHDLGVVAEVAHSVVVMYAGQMVEAGPTAEILKRPRHPYTRALLGSVPRANADRQQPLAAIPGTVPDPRHVPAGCRFHPRCPEARQGLCDAVAPQAETQADGRLVRCLRWREI